MPNPIGAGSKLVAGPVMPNPIGAGSKFAMEKAISVS
jgi:hypothetical protein